MKILFGIATIVGSWFVIGFCAGMAKVGYDIATRLFGA